MGYDPDSFWDLAPVQFFRRVRAANKRLIREHNSNAWLAYTIAALSRSKKLPKLKSLTVDDIEASVKRKNTQEQDYEAAMAWVGAAQLKNVTK